MLWWCYSVFIAEQRLEVHHGQHWQVRLGLFCFKSLGRLLWSPLKKHKLPWWQLVLNSSEFIDLGSKSSSWSLSVKTFSSLFAVHFLILFAYHFEQTGLQGSQLGAKNHWNQASHDGRILLRRPPMSSDVTTWPESSKLQITRKPQWFEQLGNS
jgi:hypothetical protein